MCSKSAEILLTQSFIYQENMTYNVCILTNVAHPSTITDQLSTVITVQSSTVITVQSSTVITVQSSTVITVRSSTVITVRSSTVITVQSSTVITVQSSTVITVQSSTVITVRSSTVITVPVILKSQNVAFSLCCGMWILSFAKTCHTCSITLLHWLTS